MTTGAAFLAAHYHSLIEPETQYMFIPPDNGYRYLNTVYNPAWLEQQGIQQSCNLKKLAYQLVLAERSWSFVS